MYCETSQITSSREVATEIREKSSVENGRRDNELCKYPPDKFPRQRARTHVRLRANASDLSANYKIAPGPQALLLGKRKEEPRSPALSHVVTHFAAAAISRLLRSSSARSASEMQACWHDKQRLASSNWDADGRLATHQGRAGRETPNY